MEADTITRRLVPGWIPVFPVKWELNQWWAAASMPTQCLRRRRQQLWGPSDSGLHYHLNLLWVTDYHSPSTALFQHRLRSFQTKTWCNLFLFTNQSFLTDNHWMLLQLDVCEEWIALNDILGLWEHFALISERHAFPTLLLWAQAHFPSAQWGFPDRAEGWGLQWEPCVFPCFLCVINLPAFQFSHLFQHLEHTPIGRWYYYLWHKCFSDEILTTLISLKPQDVKSVMCTPTAGDSFLP